MKHKREKLLALAGVALVGVSACSTGNSTRGPASVEDSAHGGSAGKPQEATVKACPLQDKAWLDEAGLTLFAAAVQVNTLDSKNFDEIVEKYRGEKVRAAGEAFVADHDVARLNRVNRAVGQVQDGLLGSGIGTTLFISASKLDMNLKEEARLLSSSLQLVGGAGMVSSVAGGAYSMWGFMEYDSSRKKWGSEDKSLPPWRQSIPEKDVKRIESSPEMKAMIDAFVNQVQVAYGVAESKRDELRDALMVQVRRELAFGDGFTDLPEILVKAGFISKKEATAAKELGELRVEDDVSELAPMAKDLRLALESHMESSEKNLSPERLRHLRRLTLLLSAIEACDKK